MLRIALIPVATLVGLNLSYLLGTSVVVENVFAVNGIGQQLVSAILQRDFVVVQGIALVFGLVVIGISVTVEVIQVALDPGPSMSRSHAGRATGARVVCCWRSWCSAAWGPP